MHNVGPALQAAGMDVNDLVMSTSSTHGARQAARQSTGEKVKKQFQSSTPLAVHLKGKLLLQGDGRIF
jgi:hypothetical protein